jgi:hypothetical protein
MEEERRRRSLERGPAARSKAAWLRSLPAPENAFDRPFETTDEVAVARSRLMVGLAKGTISASRAGAIDRMLTKTAARLAAVAQSNAQEPADDPVTPMPVQSTEVSAPVTSPPPATKPQARELTPQEVAEVEFCYQRDFAMGFLKAPLSWEDRVARYLPRR